MKLILIAFLIMTQACVSGLNTNQKRKLSAIQNQLPELYEEEKSVPAAVALGSLPGGGSFYTRNYGTGLINLLLWPLAVLWEPINGYNGATEINYYASKAAIKAQEKKEISALKQKLIHDEISDREFALEVLEVNKKYDLDHLL